jgi:histone-binding protein RBBP4
MSEEMKERVIAEEFRVWKKNTPYLYDCVLTHALEWPSLTCDWLPGKGGDGRGAYEEHKLVLGTHTAGPDPNYLIVAEVRLPGSEAVLDAKALDEEKGEAGGYGAASASGGGGAASASAASAAASASAAALGKVEFTVKMLHEGEVNRARHCPQHPFLLATKGPSGDAYVYDYSLHPREPPADALAARPQLRLKGHSKEGYGLAWSALEEGRLASGSDDRRICVWDTKGHTGRGAEMLPVRVLDVHGDVVEDVAWHPFHRELLGSVGDDQRFVLLDMRQAAPVVREVHAHDGEANCLSFNPFHEHLFVTGGGDHRVKLWDMRNVAAPLHVMNAHVDDVYQVQWAPFRESVFASAGGSDDRRVAVWDLARIGAEQSEADEKDGPPELLFLHGGHTARIQDLSWDMNEDWFVASVAADNVLQIWQMAGSIYAARDVAPLPAATTDFPAEDRKAAASASKSLRAAAAAAAASAGGKA